MNYDWNRKDPTQYCQHGTFIGSWWGPDLLCGWCEDGIAADHPDFRHAAFWERNAKRKERQRVLHAIYDNHSAVASNATQCVYILHSLDDMYRVH